MVSIFLPRIRIMCRPLANHRNQSNVASRANRSKKKKKERRAEEEKDHVPTDADSNYGFHHFLKSTEVEAKRRPKVDFLETVQSDITANMRETLVDWLVEVTEEFKLLPDTIYRTVSYIDRFLSSNAINRNKLQLLGVSAMLVATKYAETNCRNVEDFCYITDNTCTKQEVVQMEYDILKILNFEMGGPTIKTFLGRYVNAGQESRKYPKRKLEFLADYLAELSLLDYDCCVGFLPSVVAAAAVFVARFTIKPTVHPWSSTLQKETGYKLSELRNCIVALHDLQLNRKMSTLIGVRGKYMKPWFQWVSTLVPSLAIPASYLREKKRKKESVC